MTVQSYTPSTFNGTAIDGSGNIKCLFTLENGPIQSMRYGAIESAIPGLGDRDVRGQASGSTWQMRVRLASASETNVQTMLALFNHEAGAVYLVALDGNGASWRTQCRVLLVEQLPGTDSRFLVTLRVADPRWQENTATTSSSGTVTPINFTLTNNGNRQARAAYTLTAVAAKTGVANDFGLQLQGFIVNRAPNPIDNKPVALFDVSGTSTPIDMTTHTAPTSGALGDDCRVWLDDVPDIPRWVARPGTATAEVWINVSLPVGIGLTTTTALTVGAPANGGSITFNEDISRLPAKGFLAFIKEGANSDEIIYYASKAGRTVYGVQRGLWGTAASAHVVGTVTAPACFANPRHYVVGTSNSGVVSQSLYGPPPAPTAQRPCIQLNGSSNQTWKWGDQADDASTIYYDRANPDRSAQWVPGFDLDGNTVSPLMSLSQSDTILTFKDDVPGDGSPPYNFVEQAFPQGIKAADTAAVQNTWTSAAEILNLELFTRDAGGTLKLQESLQTGAAAANRSLPTALASTAYGVKLKCRHNVVTGFYETATGASTTISNTGLSNTTADGNAAVQFILDQATLIDSVVARLACTGAGTQVMQATIHRDASNTIVEGDTGMIANLSTASVTSTTAAMVKFTAKIPVLVPAGTHWLMLCRATAVVVTVNWYRISSNNSGNSPRRYRGALKTTGVWDHTFGSNDFKILSAYDASSNAPVQGDMPLRLYSTGARTGTIASFDKSIVTFPTSPAQSIYVHRAGGFAATLYHAQGLLTNSTTGDTMQFDKWMAVNATLVVDADNRTVTYTEAAVDYPVTKAVTFSDTADWMPLAAGANVHTYVDAGLVAPGSMSIGRSFRGTKV